ncbi:MAG: Acetyltransferase, GNAT family [Candidatus Roizmanbacteria bacterium GW2011_GWA2_34_18]|uniref:Acetyltransferase, GNAT family n=1 Tax=Candidatus Roizmanbacteria bacterium GW2011_GWA2_34_18 TaxID=1618477 RepID=A0A0G0ASZ7_9BACT|nr:MAG: Acetyltransferase, GNAT family [Candidatus Roizmanbacteria bacterium GW2011_GWA2_34_18]
MSISYKEVKTINDFIDVIRIRTDIFIIEQKCPPGWEPDELDKKSIHFIAILDHEIVATARLREEPKNTAKIERMAVRKEHRGKGIGLGLTKYVLNQALKKGFKKIFIQAQLHAQKMYEKAGFKITSKPYDLWNLGIPHVDMEYVSK